MYCKVMWNTVMIQVILIASLLFGQFQYELDRDGYAYYGPISENNLFRPLGWKKPDLSPKYELLATVIGKDKKYFKAYIRDMRNGRDYFVGIGDNVGSGVVEEIHRGLVRLDEEEIKGDTFGFINTSARKRTSTRKSSGKSTSSGTGTKSTEIQATQDDTRVRSRTIRGRVGGGGEDWQARISQFQNASPEERQSMIEQFRSMRGNRGGDGRGRRRNR